MGRRALIATAERSRGAHALRDALERAGLDATFTTLPQLSATPPAAGEIRIDRSLPPYDLPAVPWPGTWWNRPDRVWRAWSKQHTALAACGSIPHPKTFLFEALDAAKLDPQAQYVLPDARAAEIWDTLGGPVVVKPDRGMQGAGLMLAVSVDELAEAFRVVGAGVAQQYVPCASTTLRLLCTRRRAVAAFERIASPGDWRGNVSAGASVEPVELPADSPEVKVALDAMRVLDLDFAGVDIVQTTCGPLFLGANPSFGVGGLLKLFPTAVDDLVADLLHALTCRCGVSGPHDCFDDFEL